MTVNVPAENAEKVGLRRVIDEEMVEQVLEVLHGSGTKMPKNWNAASSTTDKMKTGDIFELAEVVRNLRCATRRRVFPRARSRCS